MRKLESRDLGNLLGGFAMRIAAAGFAVYMASYGAIALCDALERVSQALPH